MAAGTRAWVRTAGKLARRQQARARLAADAAQRQEQASADRADKIGRLQARAAARAATAQRAERADSYQRRAAAKAGAGSGRRPDGRPPVPADDHCHVRTARRAAEKARQALAAAQAALAAAAEPAKPPRANTTDPSSRVMPGKHGGFLQGYNPQVVAGAGQVILSVGTHDSPNDVAALHPALALARANPGAAGISQLIGQALFDAGYASEDNFTAPARASCTSPSPKRAARPGGCGTAASAPAPSRAGRPWPPGWTPPTAKPSINADRR